MKPQILVVGADAINQHLAEGWRAVLLASGGQKDRIVAILEWPDERDQ